ncbi:dual specificity protein phosphatase 26 isoform X3 [Salminus brasiliensis]|uniref:dual specificity protein phosphatase 26 isoform X3 n=1 Tax=Salminus brasiliensis TaxID=930266 RepID=UPI003B839B79
MPKYFFARYYQKQKVRPEELLFRGVFWKDPNGRFSRSRSNSRSPSRRESDKGSPVLTIAELERLLYTGKTACNHADEVWPRLYIGDQDIASDRRELIKLGITHILNCAQSKWRGGAEYYEGMNITYHGIEAHDSPSFDMSVNFYPAAEFIHKALSMGGTVLVHCAVGGTLPFRG